MNCNNCKSAITDDKYIDFGRVVICNECQTSTINKQSQQYYPHFIDTTVTTCKQYATILTTDNTANKITELENDYQTNLNKFNTELAALRNEISSIKTMMHIMMTMIKHNR